MAFQLRPYQQDIVERTAEILFRERVALLAAECRTGKSLMSLSIAFSIGSKGILFVTPKRVIPGVINDYNLIRSARETEAMTDNQYVPPIYVNNGEALLALHKKAGKMAEEEVSRLFPSLSTKGVKRKKLVTEAYHRIEKQLVYEACNFEYDLVIVDECHRYGAIPKPSGAQQAIKKLAEGKRVLLMSGTPTPENYSMLYHQFAISEHSPWKEYKNFYAWARAGYVTTEEKMINGYHTIDYSNGVRDRIMADVNPLMVTLTQQEAGFSVEVNDHELFTLMSKDTASAIRKMKRESVCYITDAAGVQHEIVAQSAADRLNKIHQMAGGTIKVSDTETIIFDRSKAKYLHDHFFLHHVAIFYVYKAERDLLIETFGDFITEDAEEFQREPLKIFIGQIRSVREGLRLDTAECSIFYSTEYSYVSWAQGLQRIASKERKDPATVYVLTSQCKIEAMILQCVRQKEDFTMSIYYKHE